MNRFALKGMIAEAADGRRIICVAPRREITESLHEAMTLGADTVDRVSLTRGCESVRFKSGGRISFAASEVGLRGRTAEVVFLSDQRDGLTDRVIDSAWAAVAACGGEVVRA